MSIEIPKDAGLEGIAGDDPSTLIIPRRDIVQPTTKLKDLGIKASPGDIIDKRSKVVFTDGIDVVVLRSKKSRLLMPPYGVKENKPRCWSADSITPSSRVEVPLSPTGLCKDCEHRSEDEQVELLCYDVKLSKENGFPNVFWLTGKKSSLNIVRNWLGEFRQRGKRPVDFVVNVSGEQGKSTNGNFFVLKFGDLKTVPASMKEDVAIAYSMYSGSASDEGSEIAEATGAAEATGVKDDDIPF